MRTREMLHCRNSAYLYRPYHDAQTALVVRYLFRAEEQTFSLCTLHAMLRPVGLRSPGTDPYCHYETLSSTVCDCGMTERLVGLPCGRVHAAGQFPGFLFGRLTLSSSHAPRHYPRH